MTEDDKIAGAQTIGLHHLLRLLEHKGILSVAETQDMLDDVLEEMRQGIYGVTAHRAVGRLFLPLD